MLVCLISSNSCGNSRQGGIFRGAVAAAYGKVYFASRDSYIYAVSAENGELVWRYKTGWISSPGLGPAPIVVDGRVYIGSWDNYFYALDAETGELKWRFYTGRSGWMSGVDSAPVVVDNIVYFGSWNGYFYAVDANTGNLIWSFSDGNGKMGHVMESMAFVNGVIYFGTGAGSGEIKKDNFDYMGWVYALDAEDGSLLWEFHIGDEIAGALVVADGKVFIGAGFMGDRPGDGVYALDAQTGELIWYFDTDNQPVESYITAAHGRVFFWRRGWNFLLSIC